MCTVSFIAVGEKIFITSNRDESHLRLPSAPPRKYRYLFCEMMYPKDGEAGGSWISICDNGNAGVLLNGAFESHKKKPPYKKSRGLLFLDLLNAHYPLQKFILANLTGVEPFTIILWQQGDLYELRWDANATKYSRSLSVRQPHIWSSVTLYDKNSRQKRQRWFHEWLTNQPQPSLEDIRWFHRFGGADDPENALFRSSGEMTTISTTTMELGEDAGKMFYTDFMSGNASEEKILFT